MRMMMQLTIPVEAGNEAARKGTLGAPLQKMLEPFRAEAVYFTTSASGERSGFVIFDMNDTSQLPGFAEPFFLTFNARVTFAPVMSAADLAKAAPAIEKAVKEYSRAASA